MNILILGSGGREHALAWKIHQSKLTDKLYVAPGNAGTSRFDAPEKLDPMNFEEVAEFVLRHQIGMVVVGPEAPLVAGIYDYFKSREDLRFVKVIGPSAQAALLEGSKDFAKEFMTRHEIPTASYQTFTKNTLYKAFQFLETLRPPYVIKADGLAAGKGVLILENLDDAKRELSIMLNEERFGAAGLKVVIEEFLKGVECSVFVLTDGKNYLMLPNAKDYKRIGEGDTGPNTGGMGAVSPVPFMEGEFLEKVERRVVKPTIDGLAKDGLVYKGFIYFGLMNHFGEPYVIEYNCRMGDPETQVVMPRIESDLVELFESLESETLNTKTVTLSEKACCTVVIASGGYPDNYHKGRVIHGLPETAEELVFHAGTRMEGSRCLTSGGRVLTVSALGKTLPQAIEKSYATISKLQFDDMYFRRDIGQDILQMNQDLFSTEG